MTFTMQRFAHDFNGHRGLTIPAELAAPGIPIQVAPRRLPDGRYTEVG
jgi:hypothetical protein